ncbi:DNA polymerase V [Enterococcus sp. DIV1283b]
MMDYSKDPVNDYFLIDMKFYSSVECIERNLDPLTTELIVMSRADNTGEGLILASSPAAKKNMVFLMSVDQEIYRSHFLKRYMSSHHA